MFRIALFLIVLLALAFGFTWFADNPGSVTLQWNWLNPDQAYEVTLLNAVIALSALVALVMMGWWLVSTILHSPESFGRWRAGRRRDKGYNALSRGLVAAGAGNAPMARRLARESNKLLSNEPLVKLLDAQTAILEGKRDEARSKFEAMLDDPDTKLLGLKGLYAEAEKEGNAEAAAHFATLAYDAAPETPWAASGVLRAQGTLGNWDKALKTLEANRASGLFEKSEYNRKRAVILTALAMQEEDADPDRARTHALAAHKLAQDLSPAAVIAARLSVRLGDLKRAAKVLEAGWKAAPHPDIAEAYIHLRPGDSNLDRLKRAEAIAAKKPHDVEGLFAIASTAIDAAKWTKAREAMEKALQTHPSERACLLMADIEEAQSGDQGRVREWLARAVHAPRDAAWTADGYVSDAWAPFSPLTGEIDAFEWRVPLEQIGGPAQAVDYSRMAEPAEPPREAEDDEPTTIELAVAANAAASALEDQEADQVEPEEKAIPLTENEPDIEDAEIIEIESTKTEPKDDKPADVEQGEEPKSAIKKPEAKKEAEPVEAASREASTDSSPFRNMNLDPDDDGIVDHFPDDPGVEDETKKKRKNLFF